MEWKKYPHVNQSIFFTNGEVSFLMVKVPNTNLYLGETLVTQMLWMAVMGDNPSHFADSLLAPVENITHADCQVFIKKLNDLTNESFRLPTTREWLFGANDGVDANKYSYAGSDDPEEVGWFDRKTHPVRLKKPNGIGLFDMTGNVWEWSSTVAPEQHVLGDMPKEYIKCSDGTIKIPTFYFLKGGSCMNGYRTSKLSSNNIFGEHYRNWHLGMRLAL